MKSNKQRGLLTNVASYAILQIVNMLVGLFLPRLYLAVYGSEVNGIISTVNSFTTYFSYLEAGLGLTLIHSLFKPLADQDTKEINGILSYSSNQYRRISFLYFILVVGLTVIFPFIRVTDEIGTVEFMGLVFVIGIYGALDFFSMAKYRVLLTADRKEYVISNAMILAQFLRFVFTWILLQFEISVALVKTIPIVTLLIRSIILRLYIQKNYKNVNYSSVPSKNTKLTENRWDALLLQIAISTSVSLPTIIISQVLGYKEANVYAVYSLVIHAVISIVSALSSGVSPMLGKSIASGKDIRGTYDLYDGIVGFVITVVFSITAVMIIPFIELYTNVVSDINYIHPEYAILIAIWGALYSYRIPVTAVINAAGIYRENRMNNLVNLLLQIILGVIAAIIYGITGLLIVMIVASLHRNISLTVVNSKVLLHTGIRKCIFRQCWIVITIILSFMLTYRLIARIEFSIALWILVSCIIAVIESILCCIAYVIIDKETVKYLYAWLRRVVGKI